jgi:hypothetical protein
VEGLGREKQTRNTKDRKVTEADPDSGGNHGGRRQHADLDRTTEIALPDTNRHTRDGQLTTCSFSSGSYSNLHICDLRWHHCSRTKELHG